MRNVSECLYSLYACFKTATTLTCIQQKKGGRRRTRRTVGVRSVPLVADARQLPRDVTSGAADRQRVERAAFPRATVASNRRVRTPDHCIQHMG